MTRSRWLGLLQLKDKRLSRHIHPNTHKLLLLCESAIMDARDLLTTILGHFEEVFNSEFQFMSKHSETKMLAGALHYINCAKPATVQHPQGPQKLNTHCVPIVFWVIRFIENLHH